MNTDERVRIHFIEDGFTALGRIWLRGMELTLRRDSPGWQMTVDRQGRSWMDLTEDLQRQRYGKVHFRTGPWQGKPWSDQERPFFQKDFSDEGSWEERWWIGNGEPTPAGVTRLMPRA